MTEHDFPDCAFATPRRASTTSPLQALALLNHSFTLDMAEALAGRLRDKMGAKNLKAQVSYAFHLLFNREPTDEELNRALLLVEQYGVSLLCRALLNANELVYLE
jgi:hypothetical protein